MVVEVYEHPGRNGNVRIVYDNGTGGIVEVGPWGMAKADSVPDNWRRLVRAPADSNVQVFRDGAADALAGWHNFVKVDNPLASVGNGLAFMLNEAVQLIRELAADRS